MLTIYKKKSVGHICNMVVEGTENYVVNELLNVSSA